MQGLLGNKKLMMILGITILVGLVVVGGIIFFMTAMESEDPKVKAQKEEQMKQANGYYVRITELQTLMHTDDYTARTVIDTIMKGLKIDKLDSIERMPKGQGRGNYLIRTGPYNLDTLMYGKEVKEIRIGKLLVFRKDKPDKDAILVERVYTFAEYDNMVTKFAKDLELDKTVAAKNFELLTSLDITTFTDVKKFKDKATQQTGFTGRFGSIPLKILLSGTEIVKVGIDVEELGDLTVYTKGMTISKKLPPSIRNMMPMYAERTSLAEALTNTVAIAMKQKPGAIVFPVAIQSGDDNWLMVKVGNIVYVSVDGDIKDGEKTTRKHFTVKVDAQTKMLQYLKVNKDVIMGK